MNQETKKKHGVFFTESSSIAEKLLSNIHFDKEFVHKKVLEPSVGEGHLVIKLLEKLKNNRFTLKEILFFIQKNLFINDINEEYVSKTIFKINEFLQKNFNHKKKVSPNHTIFDFSKKIKNNLLFDDNTFYKNYINKFDIVFGNPPFVTLYGRRDKKNNENQRIEYLKNFNQFPDYLKNGKINLLMLFIENGLDLLKKNGELIYICDGTFFEKSFEHTRKYLLENFFVDKIHINLREFEDVYSSQLILKLINNKCKEEYYTTITDDKLNKEVKINQSLWINKEDNYKIRFYFDKKISNILTKIKKKVPTTLYEIYPGKKLRTSSMLLTYEEEFTITDLDKRNLKYYNFYNGSKSLKEKYGELIYKKLFFYDRDKQNKINDKLKIQLIKQGIKNKKRIGLGEKIVHEMPKVYIRQSSKDIIATLDMNVSTANNSLYLFTLRSNDPKDIEILKYICGLLNSKVINFYCRSFGVIRSGIAKQPQMNISDLYLIPYPTNINLQKKISELVDNIYKVKSKKNLIMKEIDRLFFLHFELNEKEIDYINHYLDNF